MRFIFTIQGEGRGHFTQAITLEQILRRQGDEVVAILVGKSSRREIPSFFTTKVKAPVYSYESPNFLPTPLNKRSPLLKSIAFNLKKLSAFRESISFIDRKIKELQPDMVINFYELMTGLTYLFKRPRTPMVCIGHQYLFLHKDFVFPRKPRIQLISLRFFTRLTAIGSSLKLALSFYNFPEDLEKRIVIVPPLLREEVLCRKPTRGNYIHGYLLNNGYVEEIAEWHRRYPHYPLHFFWDRKNAPETQKIAPGFTLHRIDDNLFIDYMAGCKAFATTAGFESVCEALYLQKPVLMVPVHIEQECNAFDAIRAGAGIRSDRFDPETLLSYLPSYRPNPVFRSWTQSAGTRIYATLRKCKSNSREKAPLYTRCIGKLKSILSIKTLVQV